MALNPAKFLRLTPRAQLKDYLRAHRIEVPVFDWEAKTGAFIAAFTLLIAGMDSRRREQVYRHFEQVEQLCGEIGQRALKSAFHRQPAILRRLSAAESDRARGLIALLEDEAAFEKALAYRHADGLRVGRSYKAYTVSTGHAPGFDGKQRTAFEAGLRDILIPSAGNARHLVVETFERPRPAASENAGTIFQCSVAFEGDPQFPYLFEAEGLTSRCIAPALEAAIFYDPEQGLIEVAAAGGKPVLDQVAALFGRTILAGGDHPEGLPVRAFDLDRLKRPHPFDHRPSDGIKEGRLISLTLHGDDAGHARVTLELGPDADLDLWTAAEAWFADTNPLSDAGWRVQQARIKVVFHKLPGERRDKTINIDLRWPGHCNLKDQLQREQLLAERYLTAWGLIVEPALLEAV